MPAKHPLFTVTHWLLKAASWLVMSVAILLGLALGGLLVAAIDPNHLGIQALKDNAIRDTALGLTAIAVSCGLVCIVLVLLAVRLTTEILESAISGDPFVSANASRLAHIGWILLTVEIIGLLSHPIFDHLLTRLVPENLREHANIHFGDFGFGMSPIGLLAILLIFVLAQIFRRGSEMRAELEATV
jgi:hypothetical protein